MIKARFIGIDNYQDPQINNLTGAVRDARALYALFVDTLNDNDSDCSCLVNENATYDDIRYAITETLNYANDDDQVILFFAGHGTRNHRLVAFDTIVQECQNTTYDMSELAELFRNSRAQSIICILDCCLMSDN